MSSARRLHRLEKSRRGRARPCRAACSGHRACCARSWMPGKGLSPSGRKGRSSWPPPIIRCRVGSALPAVGVDGDDICAPATSWQRLDWLAPAFEAGGTGGRDRPGSIRRPGSTIPTTTWTCWPRPPTASGPSSICTICGSRRSRRWMLRAGNRRVDHDPGDQPGPGICRHGRGEPAQPFRCQHAGPVPVEPQPGPSPARATSNAARRCVSG